MSEILTIDTGAVLKKPEQITPLPVYDDHHPMLSKPIPEYKGVLPDPNIQNLVARLKMTMKLYNGLGLSANQCGVFQRVFVMGAGDFLMTCINPKLLGASADMIKESEGCLSYPGLYLKIDRPKSIDVEFTTETGEVQRMTLDGLTARCFLHELDHMNGKKFVEYVGPVSLQTAKRKQEKLIKKMVRLNKHGV
jgi:peptide deformylase